MSVLRQWPAVMTREEEDEDEEGCVCVCVCVCVCERRRGEYGREVKEESKGNGDARNN